MTDDEIAKKLHSLRLNAMAEAFLAQEQDSHIDKLSFLERFSMLVDCQYNKAFTNGLQRRIKNSCFDQPNASITALDHCDERNLSRDYVLRLAGCSYIAQGLNLFITGASGTGKTYLACALGVEACKQKLSVLYVRMSDLIRELARAKTDPRQDRFSQVLEKYAKPKLLILDEWLLSTPSVEAQRDLLALFDARCRYNSTIFCSLFTVDGWYERFGVGKNASALVESILDRIIYNHVDTINLTSALGRSQREIHAKSLE